MSSHAQDGQDVSRLDAIFHRTPIHRALGVHLERLENGVALKGAIGTEFARQDGLNFLHGGAVATLLDSATNFAVFSETRQAWATIDLRVDYIRPTALGDIEVRAWVVHAGASVGRARAELRDGSGKLTAVATATLLADKSFVRAGSRETRAAEQGR